MKRSASENIWLVIKYISLIGFTILCIYPLVWLFLASFKTNAELYTNTWGLPEQWSMTNYVNECPCKTNCYTTDYAWKEKYSLEK
jgi:raffinose/stachyose/melibiose transport system permease protein